MKKTILLISFLLLTGTVLAGQTIIQRGNIVTDVFNATALFVERVSGHQLKGDIDASGNKVTNLADPESLQDAATKAYVDSLAGAGKGCWRQCAYFKDTAGDDIDDNWADGCNGHKIYKFACTPDGSTRYEYVWNTEEEVDFSPSTTFKTYFWSGDTDIGLRPELEIRTMSQGASKISYQYLSSSIGGGVPHHVVWGVWPYSLGVSEGKECTGVSDLSSVAGDEYWIYYFDENATCYEANLQVCPFDGTPGDVYARADVDNCDCWTGWCQLGTDCTKECKDSYFGHMLTKIETYSGSNKIDVTPTGTGICQRYPAHVETCVVK